MKNGIIVRNTPAHCSEETLAQCAFAFVEAEAFTRGCPHGNHRIECLPMISAFLGAKAWPVKKSEIHYVRSSGATRILCFPDLRNVKYGCLESFRAEMTSIETETAGIDCILHVAVDCLTPDELAEVIAVLGDNRFDVMLGFGGGDDGRTASACEVVAGVMARVPAPRIWCAFWEAAELQESISGLEKLGIHRVAALA